MGFLDAMRQITLRQCWHLSGAHEQRKIDQLQKDIRVQETRVMQAYHFAESASERGATLAENHDGRHTDGFEVALHKLHLAHEQTREQQHSTAHLRICHTPKSRDQPPMGWPMLSFEQLQIVRKNAVDARREMASLYPERGRDLDRRLRLDSPARDAFLRAFDGQEAEMHSRLGIRNYPWARELALAVLL